MKQIAYLHDGVDRQWSRSLIHTTVWKTNGADSSSTQWHESPDRVDRFFIGSLVYLFLLPRRFFLRHVGAFLLSFPMLGGWVILGEPVLDRAFWILVSTSLDTGNQYDSRPGPGSCAVTIGMQIPIPLGGGPVLIVVLFYSKRFRTPLLSFTIDRCYSLLLVQIEDSGFQVSCRSMRSTPFIEDLKNTIVRLRGFEQDYRFAPIRLKWDDLQYMGGDTFVEVVSIHLNFLELQNLVYEFTKFDRTYDVIISSLVKTESGRRKYRLQRDSDVRFLLPDQTVVPEVYVDLVKKVVRDVREQPAIPSRISQIPNTCEADEQERVDDNDSYALDEIHQPREVLSNPEDDVVDTNSDSDLDGQDVADTNTEGRNQYTNTEG
ncbi:hypothetical protein Ddye_006142 [Dipteronia dyeriana]|uniref:Uncharacterized protein n=1 Tax=Dipteronia dyeriana TaxID=168575 RepID=A0AAD9XHL1_9ROSI|nr:hypothetical protein Ddye_006142 [Dipteronia dyeriana]